MGQAFFGFNPITQGLSRKSKSILRIIKTQQLLNNYL